MSFQDLSPLYRDYLGAKPASARGILKRLTDDQERLDG